MRDDARLTLYRRAREQSTARSPAPAETLAVEPTLDLAARATTGNLPPAVTRTQTNLYGGTPLIHYSSL
jgi:hypothetical protein